MQTHRLRTKIKDDLFNMDTIAQYFLCLKLSKTYIEVVVFDTKIDRCVAYEYHDMYEEDKTTGTSGLTNFIKHHSFLHIVNWKAIYFMECGLQYSFVPEEYHHANYTASFLRLTADIDKQSYVMRQTQHVSQNSFCHFATPKYLTEWANSMYRDREISWVHQTSAFIEGLSKHADKIDSTQLHVFHDKNYLCIVHFKNGKINFVNSFESKDDADRVYYILLVMKELLLDQEDTRVWLYGELEEDKGLFPLLATYLPRLKMGVKPKNQNFGYRFDDMKTWQGFDIFSTYYFTK